MEKYMVFDDKEKKRLMMISFLPGILLVIDVIYYLIAISPVFRGFHEPGLVMNYTLHYYDTMLLLLGIYAVVAAVVLIYMLVLLTRLKNLNSGQKLIWLLILCAFVPASFVAFWAFVINKEPYYVPIHPSID